MIMTAIAVGGCFIPAVGWVACAGLQAAAYGIRTQQTISEQGGWEANKERIMVDGVLTAGTLGVGGAFRMAQFGKVGRVKGVPLVPLPKFISPANHAAYQRVSLPGWNAAANRGIPWSFGPSVAKAMAWSGPSYGIGRCYVKQAC